MKGEFAMAKYLTAQICSNGHMITSSIEHNPELMQDYCSKCGGKTITCCPNCNTPLRGKLYDDEVAIFGFAPSIDSYCPKCGLPLPWTKSAIENATLLIQEADELSEQLKSSTIESLPALITETPATNVAVVRMKKCLASVGQFTADGLRQFALDFACEFAKKSLGL